MKKYILSLLMLFSFSFCAPAQKYWQQESNNIINVFYNANDKTLDGDIIIHYVNHSPDTLKFIWFHLWPNAYKNYKTAFSDQLLENGRTDFYFSNDEQRGYINRLNFLVNNEAVTVEDHPQHQDIIKLILKNPLAPENSVQIKTPFHVKLPKYFSRSGYIDESVYVTQWYPKPAVYDRKGWHPIPYLDQGEFYSEFGNYTVHITLPKSYAVAATGNRDDKIIADSLQTVTYTEKNIHDFAWFASPFFVEEKDTVSVNGQVVNTFIYRDTTSKWKWKDAMNHLKDAMRFNISNIGAYPYKTVKVVQLGSENSGGMEYPTITLVGSDDGKSLDMVIRHEVGHIWHYGILASNERVHPWMDEGVNSFYDLKYLQGKYGSNSTMDILPKNFFFKKQPRNVELLAINTLAAIKDDQPIETTSENFTVTNYNLIAYMKTAYWLQSIEEKMGKEAFTNAMNEYYENWKFKHPYPEDLKAILMKHSNGAIDSLFETKNSQGPLQQQSKRKIKFTGLFNLKESDKIHYLSAAPLLGFNKYDKLMIGAVLDNVNFPPANFQFVLAPLFGTGSKTLIGIARASYTYRPGKPGQQLKFGVAAMKFTADNFKDSAGRVYQQPFHKIVPFISYAFPKKDHRSSIRKYLTLKQYFISETNLNFKFDSVNSKYNISLPIANSSISEATFQLINSRKLYPYQAALQIHNGKDFSRVSFTGNYLFNYQNGGGMSVRLFAGKFFYHHKSAASNYQLDRYLLTMTGPKGEEDYTYRNYFIGRNEFEGLASQQIMIRDGAFKMRTDLYSNKVGKSGDWLSAINLTTSIPNKINPLSILPIKLPLFVFADFGTYAEAWKKNAATGRFVYDAGLQLSLFNQSINIYFPLVYSKVYKDYVKSVLGKKAFFKTVSFSINLENISAKRLFPQLNF